MSKSVRSVYGGLPVRGNTSVRAGVGVFVLQEGGTILLEKRSDCGLWGLPGGKIEPGESIRQAAEREVLEETGLLIQITRLIGVYSDPAGRIVTFPDDGDSVHLVDIILEGVIVSGELTCSDESDDLRFFALDQLPDAIVPPAKNPIADYKNKIFSVIR